MSRAATGTGRPPSTHPRCRKPSTVDGLFAGWADALRAGDEQRWMAAVEPARHDVADWYRTVCTTLRTMPVTHFEQQASIGVDGADTAGEPANVWIRYCIGVRRCTDLNEYATARLKARVRQHEGRWWITGVDELTHHRAHTQAPVTGRTRAWVSIRPNMTRPSSSRSTRPSGDDGSRRRHDEYHRAA